VTFVPLSHQAASPTEASISTSAAIFIDASRGHAMTCSGTVSPFSSAASGHSDSTCSGGDTHHGTWCIAG
jgi:hypothetical protein